MTNVALVVLDTLRKDTFDRYFDWLPGLSFEDAYSTANWTVPSHGSLFTGLYPSESGVHAKSMDLDYPNGILAEELHDAGYTTRAFTANTQIMSHVRFDRGFDDFRVPKPLQHLTNDRLFDWTEFSHKSTNTGFRKYLSGLYKCIRSDYHTIPSLISGMRTFFMEPGSSGVQYGGAIEAREQIDSMDFGNSEFLFVNLMEAHEPYRVPDSYQSVAEPGLHSSIADLSFTDINGEQVRKAYDDCGNYLADQYRSIFQSLSTDFDYIITLSDHGELLGEDGQWGHEHGVHPALTHVPLVISGPGFEGTCRQTVSLIDVYYTILDICGVDSPNRSYGRSLTGDIVGHESLTEYLGLTSWSEEKISQSKYSSLYEQYDEPLRGIATPNQTYGYETMDGFETSGPMDKSEMKKRLSNFVDDLDVRRVSSDNDVPEQVKHHLESLGYV